MSWGGRDKAHDSVVFARGHMALNAEINQIVLYLGPAPLPSTTSTRGPRQAVETGLC